MKLTRPSKSKNLKKLCIYIWQEKRDDGIDTYIDHIGDESLLDEYNDSVLRKHFENYYMNKK